MAEPQPATPEKKAYSSIPGFVDSLPIKRNESHVVVIQDESGVYLWETADGKRTPCFTTRDARKRMREMGGR